jgi:hypothetical protein
MGTFLSTSMRISSSETLTPVYRMRSGENPAFRHDSTSPIETASMQEPSCSNIRSRARLVFALQA